MPTHKKGQDRDKYYHLAKEQGFRSRAAFKLIQINKRFAFLDKAKVLIDLCAAPGGWCQVAAKNMPAGSLVVGVDLMPIKAIRNVKTIVSDITTAECRKLIASELQGWKADVVLCDGAPNIGSAYSKDAYVQNELVIAALKTATDHLREGGTFCTKIYRSVDYNAIIWALQQLFEDVQTMKPNSSRSQSSEIFVVCLKYTAPHKIDPKLLDPNHVFKEVSDPGLKKVDVLHKKYDKSNKRHRSGYDEALGMTLRSTATVSEFIRNKEPVQMLTDLNELVFSPESCGPYLEHEKTTEEIKTCFKDLRVLGKIDFKKILKWRMFMRDNVKPNLPSEDDSDEEDEDDKQEGAAVEEGQEESEEGRDPNRIMSEEEIQEEIRRIRAIAEQNARKGKKKQKALAAKARSRQALGMNSNSFAEGEDMELFAIDENTTFSQLRDISEIALHDVDSNEPQVVIGDDDDDDEQDHDDDGGLIVLDDEMESELEQDYIKFITGRRKKKELGGRGEDEEEARLPTAKRARHANQPANQFSANQQLDESEELDAYVKLLSGKEKKSKKQKDSKSDSDDDSEEEEEEEDATGPAAEEEEGLGEVRALRPVSRDRPSAAAMADKWFSHPIFNSELSVATARSGGPSKKKDSKKIQSSDEIDEDEKEAALVSQMPKTDKQVRQEKRKKDLARQDRKKQKQQQRSRAKGEGDEEDSDADDADAKKFNSFSVVSSSAVPESDAKSMIKRGLGKPEGANSETVGFEIISQEQQNKISREKLLEVHDDRQYDSDNEVYDSHDRMVTLALGTMMLRKSRKKALVDASYNRFAWNDPSTLPSWFLDDETRHNKPQLPIPQALLDQIKSRYQTTGTKEIKKVAEARMRKRKRALSKLKAAKKVASDLAENKEMTEKQKLKAITKAMRTNKIDKPGKVYVVTKQTGGGGSMGNMTSSGKNKGKLKFVDKRMKKDARAMKRIEKNKKKRKK